MKKSIKTIVIIGAGISGLSAGIYAEQKGFHAIVLEKNPSVGGFCTGWYRKGMYLDGCVHWMTGTKEGTVLNEMWKNVGAFSTQDDIIYLDNWGTFDYHGTKVTFWTDLEKAEKEWKEISPEDSKCIHKFFKMVKDFISVELPLYMPMSWLPLTSLLPVGLDVLQVWNSYLWTMKLSCEKYAERFKSPALRWALTHAQPGPNNLFSMLYSYATVAEGDGGIPKGGSKPMVERMKKRLMDLGGTLQLNANVNRVIIEKNRAVGVVLSDGREIKGDYVVSCLDPKYTLNKILLNQYNVRPFASRFKKPVKEPSPSCVLISYAVKNMPNIPTPYSFECEPLMVGKELSDHLTLRNYGYDKENFVKDDKTIMSVLINQNNYTYDYWRELITNRAAYEEVKNNIALEVVSRIEKQIPEMKGNIEILDVATPYTMKRYTNASAGAYMGFCFTHKNVMFMHSGKIRGLKNFYLSGQWMQSPGGLPLALASGKFTVQRICRKENLNYMFEAIKKASV